MSGEREGKHPARPFGSTGGGFAEGETDPEEFEQDERVGSFGTGQEDPEEFPEDEKLGSYARGQEQTDSPQNVEEGTFGTGEDGEDEE
jgi:hypothetical protein